MEFSRNRERYEFLRWGQKAFNNFRVVPPGTGIVHQVNLEYLAKVVFLGKDHVGPVAFPDSLVGTDSHTTMIDGLGVVGWGVGGIEAEGVMLGQPIYMLLPEVVGMELTGAAFARRDGDRPRAHRHAKSCASEKVVGKFVEFFGAGVSTMAVADRATIGNMAPEYGATMGFFPVDDQTLRYLRQTGRTQATKSSSSSATRRSKACSAPTRRRCRRSRKSCGSICRPSSRASPGRSGRRTALPSPNMKPAWRKRLLDGLRQAAADNGSPEGRWEGEGGHQIEPKAAAHADARRRAADPGFERRADRMGRQAVPAQARRRRDRRDHQLHEHEQPQRDGRRRPAWRRKRSRKASPCRRT